MKLLGTALTMLLAANATGQQPAKDAHSCVVEGQVVRAATGEPLKSARLTLVQAGHSGQPQVYKAVTNASGHFSFTAVSPGAYEFTARRNGYVPGRYRPEGAGAAGAMLELAAGEKLTRVLFKLSAAAAIVGRITDEDGEPVAGVEVEALAKRTVNAGGLNTEAAKQFVPIGFAITNDLGEYRVHGLPPGAYYLAAIDSGMPELTDRTERFGMMDSATGFSIGSEPETNHPPLYYPGVSQRSQAQKVALRAGQEVRIDFSLHPEKTATVSGHLLDAKGKPAPGVYLYLQPHELETLFSSLQFTATTDAQGNFSIKGLSPGRYYLQTQIGDEKNSYSARQPIEIGNDDVSNIELRLSHPASQPGRLIATDASRLDYASVRVVLSSDDGDSPNGTAVKQDGTFAISGLQAGTYGLIAIGMPDGWYVKSATLDGEDVFQHGIKVADGKAGRLLELRLSRGVAQLSGSVMEDEKPIAGALVRLVPQEDNPLRKDMEYSTVADQHGSFAFQNVIPGSYRLIGTLSHDELEDDDTPDDDTPGAEEKIVLAENEHKTSDLKISKPSPAPK